MKRAGKVLVFCGCGFLLLLGVAILAFYHLVQIGEFRAFLVDEIERQTDFKVQLGDGNLEVGRILGVGFKDVALAEPNGGEAIIKAQHVTARVALLPLLRRRIIVSEIRLQRSSLRLSRDAEGKFPLLDRLLNLPFLKNNDGQFNFDLRAIKVTEGEVDFQDYYGEKSPASTQLRNLTLDLTRLRGQALRNFLKKLVRKQTNDREGALEFSLTAMLERDRQQAKFHAAGTMIFPDNQLQFDKAHWNLQTRISDAPAPLMQALSGGRLRAQVHEWNGGHAAAGGGRSAPAVGN